MEQVLGELMEELFGGARRKIKRADQHIFHLNEVFDSFLRSDFHAFSADKDSERGEHFLEISVAPMPEDIPLILGDAIHNLRTSLDFVATEIASTANKSIRYSKFPFRETREELVAAINGGLVKAAPSSVITAILDEIKPYKGGNNALYALHDLDITDKHLLIVPTTSIATVSGVDLDYGGITMTDCTFIVEGGRKIRMAGGPLAGPNPHLQIQNKGKPACKIIFSQVGTFYMEPVIPTLHQLSQLVSGCVDTIAKAFLARV